MKASNTLITPFLDGILTDIRGIYPEVDFSYEEQFLESIQHCEDSVIAREFSLVGKALELSIISGKPIQYDDRFLPKEIGCEYPRFLKDLFQILFLNSGLPRWREHTTTASSRFAEREYESQYGVSSAEALVKAKALQVLRQTYLSLSKLVTLECLYLLSRGGRFVQGSSVHDVDAEWNECIRCAEDGLWSSLVVILRLRGKISRFFSAV